MNDNTLDDLLASMGAGEPKLETEEFCGVPARYYPSPSRFFIQQATEAYKGLSASMQDAVAVFEKVYETFMLNFQGELLDQYARKTRNFERYRRRYERIGKRMKKGAKK